MRLSSWPNIPRLIRIGFIGSSFGGAVGVYAAGTNPRVAAVVSNGGWGDGERKFRGQHPTPEAWAKFTKMLEEGRDHRARTGKSLMVPRYDIVPIPNHVKDNLDKQKVGMLAPNSVEMFPAETAQSMFDFRAEEVVGNIAPRPLLLIHAAKDSVTPTEQSVEMFKRAGQPAELHLFSGVDHFLFAENSARVWGVMRDWLGNYFPAKYPAWSEAKCGCRGPAYKPVPDCAPLHPGYMKTVYPCQ